MRNFLNGKTAAGVLAFILCLTAGPLVAVEKSNEFYAKLAVEKLNALWQQWVSLEMSSGRTGATPKTFGAACKKLYEAKLIDAIPSAKAIDGWEITFSKGGTPQNSQFAYKKREKKQDDVSESVAENGCKTLAASLNSAWQQYVAYTVAEGKTAVSPDSYEDACKFLFDAKLMEEIPNPKQYPGWEVKYTKSDKPSDCKFDAEKAAKKSAKKRAVKKSDKTLLLNSRNGYCKNLNSAWQQYVAAETAKNGKVPMVPADYKSACEVLVSEKYIKFVPLETQDGYRINFVKDETPQGCQFEVIEPEKK